MPTKAAVTPFPCSWTRPSNIEQYFYSKCHSVFPESQSNFFCSLPRTFLGFPVQKYLYRLFQCCQVLCLALKGFQLVVLNISELIRHIVSLSFYSSSSCVIHIFIVKVKLSVKLVYMFPSQSFSRCCERRKKTQTKQKQKERKYNLLGKATVFCNCLLFHTQILPTFLKSTITEK